MPIVRSVVIDKFRNLPIGEYNLGKRITVITGQNATGKSTLLGMIAQPFGSEERDIWGKQMRAKFNEIFKLSPKFDKPSEHRYVINTYKNLHPEGNSVQVASYKRDNNTIRFVTGKTRDQGDGNIDIPVCYLGLKRVFPLGETFNPEITQHQLSNEERNFFIEHHRKILLETDIEITPQTLLSKRQKATLGIETKSYDSLAISAGQDNVGQILGAIISLQRYKHKMGDGYRGALLVIDEVDVTLHAASQKKLAEFLLNMSRNLNIQIIVSTHSLHFIKSLEACHSIGRNDYAVWHLLCPKGEILFEENPPLDKVERFIYLRAEGKAHQAPKVSVFLEDEEAVLFLKNILPSKLKQKLKITSLGLGFGEIRPVAKILCKTEKTLECSIWILDGDQKIKSNDPKTLLTLPGGCSVEKLFHEYLENLQASDDFWTEPYYKQNFMNNDALPDNPSREAYKKWFNEEKKHWGRGMSKLYKRWGRDNKQPVDEFKEQFVNTFNAIARRMAITPFNIS